MEVSMSNPTIRCATAAATVAFLVGLSGIAHADGTLGNVNHVVIIMQENHSFDNYFGALPYAAGGPYHGGPCAPTDHTCVDGLTCTRDLMGNYACTNSNLDDDNSHPTAFHDASYCVGPDLDHSWKGSHKECNYNNPADCLMSSPMDGFVLVNDATEQIDTGESPTEDDTIGFYNEDDLPFYYAIAQSFAINDRYFCSVIGQTFPNRSYEMAATSFGHLTTNEIIPPVPNPYKPITGTIFDLLDTAAVSWKNYYSDLPTSAIFRFPPSANAVSIANFFTDAAAGTLPAVSFVDPSLVNPATENDEHPPTDIRKGQFFVWQVIDAVRSGLSWPDTVIFFVYDEHGGFYDHAAPAPAPQGGNLNPDGINPGQCADNSNPPTSTMPGHGAKCTGHCSVTTSTPCATDGECPMGETCTGVSGTSAAEALDICPAFTVAGPYPASCANFDQLGIRVPFVAVSPFSKPGYVSHTVGDHTSLLAFIEKRFLSSAFLTARDQNADTLEDMFDFDNSPSLTTTFPMAPVPSPTDPGCTTTTTAPPTTTTTTTTTSSTTTTTFGCGPSPVNGCQAAASQKGRLQLGNGKLKFKWVSSGTVAVSDFGSPTTTTDYILCLYDANGEKLSARTPADGTCGTKPCWKASGSVGFKYKDKDGTPDGVTKETLKAGDPGHGKVQVKGAGANLQLPTLPLTSPVRVQVRQNSSSTCWDATYSTPKTNISSAYKAKSD
jgi:phospholipase C